MKNPIWMSCAIVVAALSSGCAGAIEGEWESDERVSGKRSELLLDADGAGEAKLYWNSNAGVQNDKFEIEWKESSREGRFDLEMDCKKSTVENGCNNSDFTMECTLDDDGEEMDCEGDGVWKNVEWTFEKL